VFAINIVAPTLGDGLTHLFIGKGAYPRPPLELTVRKAPQALGCGAAGV
jgi:hypothetical protein